MSQIRVEDLSKTFRVAERRAGLSGAFIGLVKRRYRLVSRKFSRYGGKCFAP